MAAHRDISMGVAVGTGMMGSISCSPEPLMAALSLAYSVGRQGLRLWGSLLQLLQCPLELQVDGCSDVTGRLNGIGQRGGSTGVVVGV